MVYEIDRKRKDNMSNKKNTSVNPVIAEEKKNALDKLKELAPVVQEAQEVIAQGEKELASQAQKSGLAYRLSLHQCRLERVMLKDKPTIIVLKCKNFPNINGIITENKTNDGYTLSVDGNVIKNVGTDKNPLTKDEEEANKQIDDVTSKVSRAVKSYYNTVSDICRTFSDWYACAVEQEEAAKKAYYEKWEKKING